MIRAKGHSVCGIICEDSHFDMSHAGYNVAVQAANPSVLSLEGSHPCDAGRCGVRDKAEVEDSSSKLCGDLGFVTGRSGSNVADPVELMRGLIALEMPKADIAEVLRSYYGAIGESVSEGGASSVSSTRSRRSLRTQRWCAEMTAMPEEQGFCYLRVVRWARRNAYREKLGSMPMLQDFVAALEPGDLELKAARSCSLYCRYGTGGRLQPVFHVCEGTGDGELIGSVYSAIAYLLRTYPWLNSVVTLDDDMSVESMPLVGRVGGDKRLIRSGSERVEIAPRVADVPGFTGGFGYEYLAIVPTEWFAQVGLLAGIHPTFTGLVQALQQTGCSVQGEFVFEFREPGVYAIVPGLLSEGVTLWSQLLGLQEVFPNSRVVGAFTSNWSFRLPSGSLLEAEPMALLRDLSVPAYVMTSSELRCDVSARQLRGQRLVLSKCSVIRVSPNATVVFDGYQLVSGFDVVVLVLPAGVVLHSEEFDKLCIQTISLGEMFAFISENVCASVVTGVAFRQCQSERRSKFERLQLGEWMQLDKRRRYYTTREKAIVRVLSGVLRVGHLVLTCGAILTVTRYQDIQTLGSDDEAAVVLAI